MTTLYTVEEARAALAALRPLLDELVEVRADVAELGAAVRGGPPSRLGGLPEFKAANARFEELVTSLAESGVEVKGVAPLLLDFPAEFDGVPVLLCWLEAEPELVWYHRADLGFLGRRRIPGE